MVKIPKGVKVVIDLWDESKRKGMVKYISDTLELIRAESEYHVHPGDPAIVVESHEGHVVIIPDNEYATLVNWGSHPSLDLPKVIQWIWHQLQTHNANTGGILSFEAVLEDFQRSPIRNFISERDLFGLSKKVNLPFDCVNFHGTTYFALKPQELTQDVDFLLDFAHTRPYLTLTEIQYHTKWSDLRIERILQYLIRTGRTREDVSYRTGNRYYFL